MKNKPTVAAAVDEERAPTVEERRIFDSQVALCGAEKILDVLRRIPEANRREAIRIASDVYLGEGTAAK